MTAVLCALIGGAALYLSTGLGGSVSTGVSLWWALALLAPVPVLWFAFRQNSRGWIAFLVALAAYLIGAANILPAYAGTLPPAVLAMAIATPAIGFAAAVSGARFIARRVAPMTGVVAFAVMFTGFDYLLSLGPNGAATSPAYSQVSAPFMIQSASVFGLWSVTFVMGLFAAAAAMYAARRLRLFAYLAAAVLVLNIGYGEARIRLAPPAPLVGVGLAANDDLVPLRFKEDEASAMTVVRAYAEVGRSFADQQATLIVFPERSAVLKPEWRSAVNAELETLAHVGHAMVVEGFDERGPTRRNVALITFANGAAPEAYAKRRLVPGLESIFVPGSATFMVGDHTGVAICKDMDFPAMLRLDALAGPSLMAVPAWDFDKDGPWHARLAIMRGVEYGFAVARAANNGLLTLSDAYGRLAAVKASGHGMVTVRGDVARGPGHTLYADIGDAFAWICLAMSVLLTGVAALARKQDRSGLSAQT